MNTNFETMSPAELLRAASEANVVPSHTIVMPGRQLAKQDVCQDEEEIAQVANAQSVPTVVPRKQRGRKSAKTGPIKNNLQDPSHLWAISGRKGPNGIGTIIFVWSVTLEAWFEVPRTKCKAAFESAQSGTVSARLQITEATKDENGTVIEAGGQRLLLIG